MLVKNNYNDCLTNLACSIQKYFGIKPKHNTMPYIDELLQEKKPQNVILMLFDGMGSRILDRTLGKDTFLQVCFLLPQRLLQRQFEQDEILLSMVGLVGICIWLQLIKQ